MGPLYKKKTLNLHLKYLIITYIFDNFRNNDFFYIGASKFIFKLKKFTKLNHIIMLDYFKLNNVN